MDPRRIVEEGYDRIAAAYAEKRAWFDNAREVSDLAGKLPPGGRVLDAGCGAGIPIARDLLDRGFFVTGVDVSREMLALAKANVPRARLYRADMGELHFDDNLFDGVVCAYALFHNARSGHAAIFQTFYRILKDKGLLLFSTGDKEAEYVQDFHGSPMFFSHHSAPTTLQLLRDSGFKVLWSRPVSSGGETHVWTLARKVPPVARYSLLPPPPPPWQMYVLECDDGSLYTGVTNNLANRLKLHQTGKGAKYTRMHPPKRVLLTLPAKSKNDALQMEFWFKGRGRVVKDLLIAEGPEETLRIWKRFKRERDGRPAQYPWERQTPKKKRSKKKKAASRKRGRRKKNKKA